MNVFRVLKFGLVGSLFIVGTAAGAEQYNTVEDAAVAQAMIWQAGGKAKPLLSSDGKVVFAFGQSMPKLTCSPTRACDVEMEPSEKVKKVVLGDGKNWSWDGAESVERGKVVAHIIFQPKDTDLESNVIVTTDRRTYHIKLSSPKIEGAYLNRVGFYYPENLTSSWSDKMGADAEVQTKEDSTRVMPSAVSPNKLAFDYRVSGNAEFKPVRIFNDGERVYIEMPSSIKNDVHPIFMLIDEKGDATVVNYRTEEDETTGTVHYVIDKLFAKAELRSGEKKIQISWKRKEKSFWGNVL